MRSLSDTIVTEIALKVQQKKQQLVRGLGSRLAIYGTLSRQQTTRGWLEKVSRGLHTLAKAVHGIAGKTICDILSYAK